MLVGLVAALMLLALPALAQEGAAEGEPAFNVAATVTFLSVALAWILEWIRSKWASLDADLLRLVSLVAGIALAFGFGLDAAEELGIAGLADPLGTIATGFAIAGVTGLFGSLKNVLRANDPKSSIHTDAT